MPTVKLNKTVFEELVGKTLPLEELKDRISMLGTDLEGIEGDEIEVEIFPNRPDMLCEQGFARAFSSFIGVKTGLREYKVEPSGQKVIIEKSVEGIRPFTACAIVRGLQLDEERIREIIQIQEKLHITYGRNRKKAAIGIYPMEKIFFPITYKADKPKDITFIPLEAHTAMTADQILTDHETGKEYGHLLEGLDKYPYFIDAKKQILSMPPIINSETVGRVTQATKDVFIECSGFDFKVLSICLNIIVTSLADMGGSIHSLELEYPDQKHTTPNLSPSKKKLDLDFINQRLGLNLSQKEAGELLQRMGYGFKNNQVHIPAYRADILHQVDFMEDIAIAYGYENFKQEIPNVATIGQENSQAIFHRNIKDILVGYGFLEVINYHLITKDEGTRKMNHEEPIIGLKNSVGEQNHLRNSLLPSLLGNLQSNQHHEYPQNLFEIGRTFAKGKTETGIAEETNLAIVLCHEKADFTHIRQILDSLGTNLDVEIQVKETAHPTFIQGRAANIIIGGKPIGILGEIHPQVLSNWDIIMPVVCLEINTKKIKI